MVLAAVPEDFLFRSKIRATAKLLGVEIFFAKTGDEILEQARTSQPRLVVFDLNSDAVDPFATIKALKADSSLATIPVIGFVSHVRVDLIDRAEAAGADQVLARSSFAENLPKILST